jgi:hypothetical protein
MEHRSSDRKSTLQVTTQQGVRTAVHPLHRQYRVDHLHLNRRRLNGDWFTDTLFSKVTSLQGNTSAQIFTKGNFTTVHLLNSKARLNRIHRRCRHSGHAVVRRCSRSYLTEYGLHEESQHTEDQTERLRSRTIQSELCCRTGNR